MASAHPSPPLRRSAAPRWSSKSSFLTAVGLVATITPIMLLAVHRSIWAELEIVTTILSLLMFAYLTMALYLGVRFDTRERFTIEWSWPEKGVWDLASWPDIPDFGLAADLGADLGPLGAILGFLLALVGTIAIAITVAMLLWIGVNLAIATVVAIFIPLFYFYRRALRIVIAHGRACRGRWGMAALYALRASVVYSVWFYLIFVAAELFRRKILP